MNFESQLSDTHPHIRNIIIEGYRRMTPQQKLRCVSDMTNSVQQMAASRIRKQYGDISESELRLRLASLWLDRETMIRVFRWDPKEKGY
jgi:hypothetical protein